MKFFFSINIKPAFLCLALASFAWGYSGMAQSINSTYSRFGIGSILAGGNIKSAGMGGVYSSLMDPSTLNVYNPASYAFMELTSLQVSGKAIFLNAQTKDESMRFSNGSIGEMAMAFKKPGTKWGFAIGLHPYSSSGYLLENTRPLTDSLNATYRYEGSGGLNEAVAGVSRFNIVRNKRVRWNEKRQANDTLTYNHIFSIGANVNYIFGNVTQTNRVVYSDVTYLNTRAKDNLFAQGLLLQGGLLYQLPLKLAFEENQKKITESLYLQMGATYTMGRDLRTKLSALHESFTYSASGAESVVDTSYQAAALRGHLTLPQKISVGISLKKYKVQVGTFLFGLEMVSQNWGNYKVTTTNGDIPSNYYKQYTSIGIGFEFKPYEGQNSDFINTLNYRLGLRMADSYLTLNSTNLRSQAVTAGVSIPLLKSNSRLHLSGEYGTFGTTENNLILEKQTTIWLGFTFTPREPWFFQRKYD